MDDLFHPEDLGQRELEQPKENPAELGTSDFRELIDQFSDKGAAAAEWLEGLFRQLFGPVIDLIDEIHKGIETERIKPASDTPVFPSKRPENTWDFPAEANEGTDDRYHISDATEEWHVQDGNYSCAVCSQQFIINEFLDLDVSEEELCRIAQEKGWFHPESGTCLQDCDNLLEYYGIDSDLRHGCTYSDLKETLDQGGRILLAVDSMVLWTEGYGNYPVYGVDHAIEVIGIDDSDPSDVRIIINDSGNPNGCGRAVPYDEFMEAWAPSGGFMISAYPKD